MKLKRHLRVTSMKLQVMLFILKRLVCTFYWQSMAFISFSADISGFCPDRIWIGLYSCCHSYLKNTVWLL